MQKESPCRRSSSLRVLARSANLIAGDGTKNGFPAPNKEPAKTKNHHLTGKAPYKFESISLLRGVSNEPVPAVALPMAFQASIFTEARNRKFESISLQRRVRCELAPAFRR